MSPNQHYMQPFWESRLEESQRAIEVALARLALCHSPNQLKLFGTIEACVDVSKEPTNQNAQPQNLPISQQKAA